MLPSGGQHSHPSKEPAANGGGNMPVEYVARYLVGVKANCAFLRSERYTVNVFIYILLEIVGRLHPHLRIEAGNIFPDIHGVLERQGIPRYTAR